MTTIFPVLPHLFDHVTSDVILSWAKPSRQTESETCLEMSGRPRKETVWIPEKSPVGFYLPHNQSEPLCDELHYFFSGFHWTTVLRWPNQFHNSNGWWGEEVCVGEEQFRVVCATLPSRNKFHIKAIAIEELQCLFLHPGLHFIQNEEVNKSPSFSIIKIIGHQTWSQMQWDHQRVR